MFFAKSSANLEIYLENYTKGSIALMKGKIVYLGLGTNMGDRFQNLLNCILLITNSKNIKVMSLSSIYESPSWGFVSNDFYNMVIKIETKSKPLELLIQLKNIEAKMGRLKKTKDKNYEERIIDIDLLIIENEIIETKDLKIPHPEIKNRAFVLNPLLEINSNILLNENNLHETKNNINGKDELKLLVNESNKLLKALNELKS